MHAGEKGANKHRGLLEEVILGRSGGGGDKHVKLITELQDAKNRQSKE